jgi:asparagine synthase (glutamine-hydrolysing)
MKSDKMSMANSLELRTPFLDYRLIEWANRQPNWVKVRWNGLGRYQTKNILRRFCETRLPQEVLRRPKRGFPVPAYGWLQGGLQDWARKTLLSSESRLAKSFRPKPMVKLVNKSALGDLTASHKVWSLIILELWLQTWDLHLDS